MLTIPTGTDNPFSPELVCLVHHHWVYHCMTCIWWNNDTHSVTVPIHLDTCVDAVEGIGLAIFTKQKHHGFVICMTNFLPDKYFFEISISPISWMPYFIILWLMQVLHARNIILVSLQTFSVSGNFLSTSSTCRLTRCSLRDLPQIIISKYTATSVKPPSTYRLFIFSWNIAGADETPKGRQVNLNKPW